eukprot:5108206-Pyramimonas_sp.AAC.1
MANLTVGIQHHEFDIQLMRAYRELIPPLMSLFLRSRKLVRSVACGSGRLPARGVDLGNLMPWPGSENWCVLGLHELGIAIGPGIWMDKIEPSFAPPTTPNNSTRADGTTTERATKRLRCLNQPASELLAPRRYSP